MANRLTVKTVAHPLPMQVKSMGSGDARPTHSSCCECGLQTAIPGHTKMCSPTAATIETRINKSSNFPSTCIGL
jgi:hypothetical protein